MLQHDISDYNYFEIDTKDIWEYERNYYRLIGQDWALLENVYELLQAVVIQSGAEPMQEISATPDGGTKSRLESYNDFSERKLVLDFFIWGNKLYDLNVACPLDQTKIKPRDYQYLFALKLRQYQGDLPLVSSFLNYHLKETFKEDYQAAVKFLEAVLLQHKKLLIPEVLEIASKWLQEKNSILIEMARQDVVVKIEPNEVRPEVPVLSVLTVDKEAVVEDRTIGKITDPISDSDSSEEIQPSELNPAVPDGYNYYKGTLNDSEVEYFFSFLYLEKDEKGESYLTKEETETMFKYGVAIPPKDGARKYRLNIGGERSKIIIYHAIHTFYINYSRSNRMKRIILKFFASYLDDFSKALESEHEMEKLSKNLTGERPTKRFFKLEKYIPVRVQDNFLIN